MRSIKPGRGPSMMGVFGSAFAVVFGIIWTGVAFSIGGGVFGIFGIVFVIYGIIQLIYNYKNATGKNRFSQFDITDNNEETDPLDQFAGKQEDRQSSSDSVFCPYCGTGAGADFIYCKKCGKKI